LEWYQQQPFIPGHWWQTESGWPMIAILLVLKMPVKSGSATKAVCGYDIGFLMKTAMN
jgi:propionyl-CoA synthetase